MIFEADPVRIEEIFINILTNAVKYSPEGTLVTIASTVDDQMVYVTVQDEGYGFTPEELQDAWHPFSSSYLRKQSLESVPGTGVRLYLAKAFTEQHGGKIEIDLPGRDQGTRITMSFPLHRTN